MSLSIAIGEGLSAFQRCRAIDNGVIVSTHCLYPNNSSVSVSVRGSGNTYVVTDDGGAFREAENAGAILGNISRRYEKLVGKQGLLIERGIVSSPKIQLEMVPAAILLVANVSKEIADNIFNTWRQTKSRDFKEAVKTLIKNRFSSFTAKETKFVGTSNKPHAFDNVIQLPQGKKLIIDAVLRDANSINSRVVANLDVRSANYTDVDQRIIYDDEEAWSANDLSILQVSGVPVVPFSRTEQTIREFLKAA